MFEREKLDGEEFKALMEGTFKTDDEEPFIAESENE